MQKKWAYVYTMSLSSVYSDTFFIWLVVLFSARKRKPGMESDLESKITENQQFYDRLLINL